MLQLSSTPPAPSVAPARPVRLSYAEKLKDPRWQRKRLEVLNAANWRCQECAAQDRTLAVHHSLYQVGKEPWEADSDLLLALCARHHAERQSVEQRIFIGIARRLCKLNLHDLRAAGDNRLSVGGEVAQPAATIPPPAQFQCSPTGQMLLMLNGQRL